MTAFRRWRNRVAEWRRGDAVEQDQQAELQSHFEHLIDDHIRRGLPPAEARRAASLELGGLEQARARARDARGFRVVEALTTDCLLALRQLRKTPAFTLAAVVTLALGIGANTAIFSLVDAVMLRPLSYADPERVVAVWEEISTGLAAPGVPGAPVEPRRIAVAPANFRDYQARVSSFESAAAFASVGRNLTGSGTPERIAAEEVTASYFRVLGVQPAIGRTFLDEENTAGRHRVAIISHSLWQRRFGGDPAITSRVVQLNNQPHDIVGVMPPDFVGPSAAGQLEQVSAWLPIVFEPDVLINRQEHIVSMIARLAPGVSLEGARRELGAVSTAIGVEFPEAASTRASLELLRRDQITAVRAMLVLLLTAVGLVLLLACINVAGLLMVRAIGRQREMAIRYALGASRARVVFEQLVQSLVLACLGGAAGVALGAWMTRVLVSLAPSSIPYIQTAGLDLRVVVFSAVVIVFTALAFGLWPAWQAARTDPIDTLKAHDRPASGGWVLARRSGLLIGEVAVTTIVVVGAALMIRSMVALSRVDLGFDPSHVFAATIVLPPDRYPTPADRLTFFEQLEVRLSRMPGVRGVAFGNRLPLRGNWISGMIVDSVAPVAGAKPAFVEAGFQAVNPAYFETVGIPVRMGRALTPGDVAGSQGVAVVNETFARTFLDSDSPIGRRIRRGPIMPPITIVGVVGDIRRTGRANPEGHRPAEVIPQVYLAAAQTALYPLPLRDVAVKVDAAAMASIGPAIQRVVLELDPDLPVTASRTLEETLALGSAQQRFQTALFVVFGLVAAGLALIGVYGVVAYGVSQRTAEIALRMALGATRGFVLRDVMWRSARLVCIGVCAGLGASYLGSGLVADLLFDVAPTDARTYTLAGILLVGSGAAAAWAAARHATRIDPMRVLK
jgi:putative ABC transport system permease protein